MHKRYLAVLCVEYQEIRGGVANLGGPPQGLSLCKQIHGTSLRFFYELQHQISHFFDLALKLLIAETSETYTNG